MGQAGLVWSGASLGRSGLATQAIAAFDIALWDLKARRAKLPLAKLLGAHRNSVACYNTSVGYLSSPLPEVRAEQARIRLAPHFAMEIHLRLAAAYPLEPWVEHFERLEPLFNERLVIRDGHMWVPSRPGLGLSLSELARGWTVQTARFGEAG